MSDNSIPCAVHYKPIPGFLLYRVGDDGSIWSSRRPGKRVGSWKRLACPIGKNGYRLVALGRGNQRYVHHLVMLAFVGERPSGMEVRHLNGRPLDNRLGNLEYGTAHENNADKKRHSTQPQGAQIWCAKLTEDQVREIRDAIAAGNATQADMMRKFGITSSCINLIVKRKRWKHLE